MSRDGYPTGYTQLKGQLVREIRDAATWSDMVDAGDALFQVKLRAEGMKEDANLTSSTPVGRQGPGISRD